VRRKKEQENNAKEIAYTTGNHFMTEDPATTSSQHAGHRYVPYHFKGLRPDQKDQIEAER